MPTLFAPLPAEGAESIRERRFALVALAFIALAFLLPPFAQPQGYHNFADAREMLGIPRALDVLSNLGFFAAGLFGFAALARRGSSYSPALRASLATLFAGVLLTAAGSAYYHWAPQDARLVWDRLPMTIAFAGVLGCLAGARVGERAARWALGAGLAYGLGSVWLWQSTGNLSPYAVMQFGGIAWVVVAWLGGQRRAVDFPWGALLGFYLAAKLFETFDAQFFSLTMGAVSGHTVKHLLSAAGAASFALAVWRAPARQTARD